MSDEIKIKATVPLLNTEELRTVDNFTEELTNEFIKKVVKDKDLLISQRLIMNLKQEIDELQQENKQLKIKYDVLLDNYNKLEQENKQLKEEPLTNKVSRIDAVVSNIYRECKQLKEEINKISKKELKVMAMLRSIENCTLTKERIDQIEEVMFELEGVKDENNK